MKDLFENNSVNEWWKWKIYKQAHAKYTRIIIISEQWFIFCFISFLSEANGVIFHSFIHPSKHPNMQAFIHLLWCARESRNSRLFALARSLGRIHTPTYWAFRYESYLEIYFVCVCVRVKKEVYNFCSDRWNNRRRMHTLAQHVRIHQRLCIQRYVHTMAGFYIL